MELLLNSSSIKTPCYILDERALRKNLEILNSVEKRTGAKILLAQKAFSNYEVYPVISEYISGTTASGIYEAMLGYEEMGKPFSKQTHVFAPAYTAEDMKELVKICDHIVFNNLGQWLKHREAIEKSDRKISVGIRVNPEYSEIETEIYNPCCKGSRLGTTLAALKRDIERLSFNPFGNGIEGIHFHTMCEQGADVLERTLNVVEEKFSCFFDKLKWLNFGGGHHITKDGYDVELLVKSVNKIKEKYKLDVYIEPGEAVALNAGYLVSRVLDIIDGEISTVVIDASAACHMPDVLEMPYRPEIIGAGRAGEKAYTYRLGGNTCLAGDIVGDYSFDKPLEVGDRLVFLDMAIYTTCKNNTFNGIPLPSIYLMEESGDIGLLSCFSYGDFKSRL